MVNRWLPLISIGWVAIENPPGSDNATVDFGVNPETGAWNAVPLETLGGLLTELAQQPAVERLALMSMREALAAWRPFGAWPRAAGRE